MATNAMWLAAAGTATSAAVAADFDAMFWPLFLLAFRTAHRILGNRHAAEDVAADAMARAHVHWNRIGNAPYREAWVVRVAGNRALDVCRRSAIEWPPEEATRFEDGATMRLSLVRALQTLPRRQREIVALRFLVGLPVDDIAAALGIGAGSVRTHLQRGLRKLRDTLGPEFAITPEEVG